MIYTDKNIILFTGNFGSGKTEVAVNYTRFLATQGLKVKIADLDIVNPYFRCREAGEILQELGVIVVAPQGAYHSADLPIILPELRGIIEKPQDITILDVGGDNIGATALASLRNAFQKAKYEMCFVLNMNRPFTGTVEGALRMMREIEEASKLNITAIVGNTHLIEESTVENLLEGARFTEKVAEASGLRIAFIGVMEKFLPVLEENGFKHKILPMKRLLLPPWYLNMTRKKKVTHARDRFGQLTK